VWDGLVAADGNLYLTTVNGETLRYSGFQRGMRQRPRVPLKPKVYRKDPGEALSPKGLTLK